MKRSSVYLLMTMPGVLIPWWLLVMFLKDESATVTFFFSSIFVNAVASAVAADVFISFLIFTLFVCVEGRRLEIDGLWVFPLLAFVVGLSCGLPLFLYYREKKLETNLEG